MAEAKKRLLIADDSFIDREILHHILENHFEITDAKNGYEALNLLTNKEEQYDAMLLDVMMPVIDGKTIEEAEAQFAGSNYGEFKREVAKVVIEEVSKIQAKYNELVQTNAIEEILNNGRDYVVPIAKQKYEIMKQKMGLGR